MYITYLTNAIIFALPGYTMNVTCSDEEETRKEKPLLSFLVDSIIRAGSGKQLRRAYVQRQL